MSKTNYKHTGNIDLPELIVCAAQRNPDDERIVLSFRHGSDDFYNQVDAIYGLTDEDGEPVSYMHWVQGFFTNKQRFVTRQEAWEIAANADQIKRVTGSPGTLFSEDLY